ncbi:hypothetical protein [Caldalkalibacillus salinus]|uniref:hypothetical protein n=1 Tax=Caldalkalibacillus salinus TaxID=2803787 RepID=UPI0019218500|nr:hypothetical protein [Caldalkalibacillus salinus]
MKKKLYIDQFDEDQLLHKAWQEVYGQTLTSEQSKRFKQNHPKGNFVYLGKNTAGQRVYWINVSQSIRICIQAWSEFWALLGDNILFWELIYHKKRGGRA